MVAGQDDKTLTSDVLIVGAGPAGTAAAIEAVRSGLSALVVDKATFPRPKCCGDGLTTSALRHLEELGFEPNSLPSWKQIERFTLSSPGGRQRSYPLPQVGGLYAAVARRSELDAELVSLARRAGAQVLENTAVVDVVQPSDDLGDSQVTATVQQGDVTMTIRSTFLIAADGMWSTIRKLTSTQSAGYRGDWHAFRQYYVDVEGPAADGLMVWFEEDLLPGYFWSFPLGDGAVNVGFGIIRGEGGKQVQRMKTLWPELLKRESIGNALGPDARPEEAHRAWPIPARLGHLPLSDGRIIFVGDAAAATDPMSGEGIGQALETGRLAVSSIVQAGPNQPSSVRDVYETHLRRTMIADHRLAGLLSRLLGNPTVAEAALALTGSSDWTRRNFARWLFEDYPRAAVFNPWRWRDGRPPQVGAYTQSA